MKAKNLLSVILVVLFATACKNEKSIDSLDVVKPAGEVKTFTVTLTAIAKKTDDFSLFYTTDGTTNFAIPALWQNVKGSDSAQDVVFELPANTIPTQIRLDFGMAKDQEDIVFKKVKFECNGKTFEAEGGNIALYFRPDLTKCTFDASNGTLKALVKDGQRQSPSMYPHEAKVKEAIESVTK